MQKQNKPIPIKAARGVRAKLWRNSNDNGEWFNVEIVKTYKDDEGNLQDTRKYSRDDLLHVAYAATKAFETIVNFSDEPVDPDAE